MKRPRQFALTAIGIIALAVAVFAAVPKQKPILPEPDLAEIPTDGDGFIMDNGYLLLRIDAKNVMDVIRGFERLKRDKAENTLRIATYGDVMPNSWLFRQGLGTIVFPWDAYTFAVLREKKEKQLAQYYMMPGDYVPTGMVYIVFRAPDLPKPEEPKEPSAEEVPEVPVVAKSQPGAPESPVPPAANTGG